MKSFYTFIAAIILFLQVNNINSQSTLCEQFSNPAFPPTGWTLQYTGTLYWSRSIYSGFNNGAGSALFDMWDAPSGVNQSLTTPIFTPTGSGDSLIMDMAYQFFSNVPDSLIILASTDGGTTFISAARLGPLQMVTCNAPPFGCRVWLKRKYWLPTGTNKIQFLGKSGFGDNLYLDSICIGPNVTGISNINSIVTNYSLEQNYPNPFNPSTSIKFSIPKSSDVKLVITDVLGREVRILVNGFKTAGNYDVNFDAGELSSGIYFYKLEARQVGSSTGTFTETKKMLLIK